jgi:hypothetical protein
LKAILGAKFASNSSPAKVLSSSLLLEEESLKSLRGGAS